MDARDDHGSVCSGCGARVGPLILACPVCLRLVHADELKQLAGDAAAAGERGDLTSALAAWRHALELLPPGSRQRAVIDERVAALSATVDTTPRGVAPSRSGTPWVWILTIGALVASKAKLLFLGLTKAGTLFSMLLAFGVYWSIWGWRFAAGFVASIFVHEMGHVTALARFGIRATAPMFLPGVGAIVRFQQALGPIEESRVGLAGPLWGLGAAVAAYAMYLATDAGIWAAIAHVGAFVNLFNLLPVVPLDGGRGFRPLDRQQRWATVAVIAVAWWLTEQGLLVLLGIGAVARAMEAKQGTGDARAWQEYAFLVTTLAALGHLAQAGVPGPLR